jgi:DNA-binding transcriptional LysR family regulator
VQQEIASAHIDLGAMIELNSVASVISCVKAGVGIALLPERTVRKDIAARHLSKLRWQAPLAADLHFLRHRDKPLAGAFGAFAASVEGYFREQRQA